MNDNPRHGDLRVWWCPQIPMKSFEVDVSDLAVANLLLDTLGRYDEFQFKNQVKPDYCNAGGLVAYDADAGDWFDWECPETFDSFDEVRRDPERLASAMSAGTAETAEQAQGRSPASAVPQADAQNASGVSA